MHITHQKPLNASPHTILLVGRINKKTMEEDNGYSMTNKENKITLTAMLILMALIALCILSSCKTKKVVTETLFVHDTLIVSHTDTLIKEKWNTRHDTLQLLTEKIITIKDNDTVKVVVNNDRYKYVYVGDSTLTTKSVVDSLIKVLDQNHNKETKVTKKRPPWDILIFAVAMLAACIIVLRVDILSRINT